MKKLTVAIALMAALLSGCASNAIQTEKYAAVADEYQMIERNQSKFDYVLERARLDKEGIQTVFVADLNFEDIEIDYEPPTNYLRNKEWALTQKDIHGLQIMFADAMNVYFVEENGYAVVSEPEEADLIVAAAATKMAPKAPKDDLDSREPGARYFSEGSGRMSVVIDVYQDRHLVMKIDDTRDAGQMWERNHKMSNRQNVRNLFKTWARNLEKLI